MQQLYRKSRFPFSKMLEKNFWLKALSYEKVRLPFGF